MTTAPDEGEATVVGLWRYPVKSMMGEELNAAEIGPRGVPVTARSRSSTARTARS